MSRAHRRPKGTGSIVQRSDGRWQFSLDLGKDVSGKRQRRTFYAATRSELLRKVGDETAKGGGSLRPLSKGTVGEFVRSWLDDDVKPNRSPNTYALYDSVWKNHAEKALGGVRLGKLGVAHVEALYAAMRKAGTSNVVQAKVASVMQRAIAVAIRRGRYHFTNPFTLVEKPAHKPKTRHTLTPAEARRFLNAAGRDEYQALWVLLLTSGLRLGEALGLQWADVDLKGGSIAVTRGLREVNGASTIGSLKTETSKRRIEIGRLAVDALRRHRAKTKAKSPFVFVTAQGTHPKRSNLRQRHFEPICMKAKVADLTIHGLRHSMTSLAIAQGISPKVVAERLGHSTVRLTLDRYSHVGPTLQREAANLIDAVVSKK